MSGRRKWISLAITLSGAALIGCGSDPRVPNAIPAQELRQQPRLAEGQRAFMQNQPTSFIGLTPEATFVRQWPFWLGGVYAQDEFRIHPRLTLNAGLRWEFMTLPVDTDGKALGTIPIAWGPQD